MDCNTSYISLWKTEATERCLCQLCYKVSAFKHSYLIFSFKNTFRVTVFCYFCQIGFYRFSTIVSYGKISVFIKLFFVFNSPCWACSWISMWYVLSIQTICLEKIFSQPLECCLTGDCILFFCILLLLGGKETHNIIYCFRGSNCCFFLLVSSIFFL